MSFNQITYYGTVTVDNIAKYKLRRKGNEEAH